MSFTQDTDDNFTIDKVAKLEHPYLNDALVTGLIWCGITVVFDAFAWVLIKHPWGLTFKEFYVDYQPWITLIYIAIAVSPPLAFFLIK